MITSAAWRGKRYAVLGLARSGAATVDALIASGAEVVAWDSDEGARAALSGSIEVADPLTLDLSSFDAVVVSPGIPLNRHPIAPAARAVGVPVIGDIELFAQARASLPPHKVVGITGTNGKSTTTALVHHILHEAGVPTTMGGNIGLPILAQDPLPEGGVYVLELSSYQIDLTHSLDCDVAVLLNITPDHLDRYGDFEQYSASKLRLFAMLNPPHIGVFNWHTKLGKSIYQTLFDTHPCAIWSNYDDGADDPYDLWGAFDTDEQIASRDHLSTQKDWPNLQGPHNAQNAISAILTCSAIGIPEEVISHALATYLGLPHRMERVRDREGILFVNDSKATNPASAAPALAAFDAVHWILGGRAKTPELDACLPHLDHVRAAYTIGEAGPLFKQILGDKVPVVDCERLTRAVTEAAAAARPGEVVLLSPAAASFDQFTNFEARGEAFRAAVEALA